MAATNARSLDALARQLLPWLHARLPDAQSIEVPAPRRPAAGGSSDTLLVDALIREHGETRREAWVLRIEATDHQIYQDPSVQRQYQVMQAAGLSGRVPVPRMLWYEADRSVIGAPFFLMERVDGAIPDALHNSGGYLVDMTPARREAVWLASLRTIAAIHALDVSSFGFLQRPVPGQDVLEQELAVWDSYRRWSGAPPRPIQDRARSWLADHQPVGRAAGLAWGDARPGNLVFRDDRCVAVLDWETASLAGAETDLGWWLFYDWFVSDGFGVARLPGLPPRDETVRLWEGFSGRTALDMEWHEVFATWRFSLISDRARYLARKLGLQNAAAAATDSPHARRLEMLLAT